MKRTATYHTKQKPPRRMFGVSFDDDTPEEPNVQFPPHADEPADEPDPGLDLSLWRSDYDHWLSDGNWTVAEIAARIVDRLQQEATEDVLLQDTVPLEALGIGSDLCLQVAELVRREIRFVSYGTQRA